MKVFSWFYWILLIYAGSSLNCFHFTFSTSSLPGVLNYHNCIRINSYNKAIYLHVTYTSVYIYIWSIYVSIDQSINLSSLNKTYTSRSPHFTLLNLIIKYSFCCCCCFFLHLFFLLEMIYQQHMTLFFLLWLFFLLYTHYIVSRKLHFCYWRKTAFLLFLLSLLDNFPFLLDLLTLECLRVQSFGSISI